jgi:hypothetical protein
MDIEYCIRRAPLFPNLLQKVRDRRTSSAAGLCAHPNGHVDWPYDIVMGEWGLMTPELLAALDELLDDYPRIDSREQGPKALKHAAREENLEAVAHLFERYGDSVKEWNGDVWEGLPQSSATQLIQEISGSAVYQPWQAGVLDGLLSRPDIDPAAEGPRALVAAAEAGSLAVVGHLFPRFGDSVQDWTEENAHTGVLCWGQQQDWFGEWLPLPMATQCFVDALAERRDLGGLLPEAMAPVQKARSMRL